MNVRFLLFVKLLLMLLLLNGCNKELEVELNYNIYDKDFAGDQFIFIDSVVSVEVIYYNSIVGQNYQRVYNNFYLRNTAITDNFKYYYITRNGVKIFEGGNPVGLKSSLITVLLYDIPQSAQINGYYKSGTKNSYVAHLTNNGALSHGSDPFEYTQP